MNNLGGMVFIVMGIALGYWVSKGRATNFLHAINFGTPSGGGNNPPSLPNPPPGADVQAPGTTVTLPWLINPPPGGGFGPGPAPPPPTSGGGFNIPDVNCGTLTGFALGCNAPQNSASGGGF